MFIFQKFEFFGHPLQSYLPGVISRTFAHKVAKSKYFEKFKLNRNLQTIPFIMMYDMSMLRHRFSNERWGRGGGGGGALNYLPLLFCKSVYIVTKNIRISVLL